MKKIATALRRALAIRQKDRVSGWWGYHQI
jgi:hypothetical protein